MNMGNMIKDGMLHNVRTKRNYMKNGVKLKASSVEFRNACKLRD